jgi:hypothetical protein
MPTQPGEMRHYQPFLTQIIGTLDCIPAPNVIAWHYTTGHSLIQIIKSGKMFSTQAACLNDSTELRYAANLLRVALTNLLPNHDPASRVGAFLRRYVQALSDNPATPSHAPSLFFVACFSELEDDLGQWRSYGGGENGIAIGIRWNDLVGTPGSGVVRVNYDVNRHTEVAATVAQATVNYYLEGVEQGGDDWDDRFLRAWDSAISYLAPIVKDPGFAIEREIRVIHPLYESEKNDIEVLQKKTMMSRHLPLTFPAGGENNGLPLLPIHRILVGPGRHQEISRVSVDTLLRSKGYPQNLTALSKRPFQET